MSRVTIDLGDDLARKLRERAGSQGVSLSRWVADLIEAELRTTWPEPVRALAGAWADFPDVQALRQGVGEDVPREPL